MRLIDADALANYANNSIVGITANDIMRFPTVDAEPVKHGRWLHNDMILNRQKCSECGFYSDDLQSDNYCPNCGARMDGD